MQEAVMEAKITQSTVPLSMFNEVGAAKVFEDVRQNGTKVVMKDDLPECVLMSPEEYVRISDECNDAKLLALAIQRMRNFDRSKLISQEEFDKMFGITEEDLEGWEDIELE